MNNIIRFSDSFSSILSSGLAEKTRLSFISSNSSFTECVSKNLVFSSFFSPSLFSNTECTAHPYIGCSFTQDRRPSLSTSTFISCTFTSITSTGNSAAIYFTTGSSLSIEFCLFTSCSSTVPRNEESGGGAVHITVAATLTIISTVFYKCVSSYLGGAVFAQGACKSSNISFCTFVECTGSRGGGLMTYSGPTSDIISSRFFSCSATLSGGAFYHNSGFTNSSVFITNSLFAGNTVETDSDGHAYRGGGAIENYRSVAYPSNYSFLFFHANIDKKENGHDITSNLKPMTEGSVVHCFTTTAEKSFCNAGTDQYDWLPFGVFSFSRTCNGNIF